MLIQPPSSFEYQDIIRPHSQKLWRATEQYRLPHEDCEHGVLWRARRDSGRRKKEIGWFFGSLATFPESQHARGVRLLHEEGLCTETVLLTVDAATGFAYYGD